MFGGVHVGWIREWGLVWEGWRDNSVITSQIVIMFSSKYQYVNWPVKVEQYTLFGLSLHSIPLLEEGD